MATKDEDLESCGPYLERVWPKKIDESQEKYNGKEAKYSRQYAYREANKKLNSITNPLYYYLAVFIALAIAIILGIYKKLIPAMGFGIAAILILPFAIYASNMRKQELVYKSTKTWFNYLPSYNTAPGVAAKQCKEES